MYRIKIGFIIFFSLIASYCSYSQINSENVLFGKWQLGTPKISDGFGPTYTFLNNGKFEFTTDENYGLQIVKGFTGLYSCNNDTLMLIVQAWTEFVGGNPEFSEIYGGIGWSINNSKKVTLNVKKKSKTFLHINGPFISNDSTFITINKLKYYKIDELK